MKIGYRLKVPSAATTQDFKEYIDAPNNLSGIQMAEWWKTASVASRMKVLTGAVNENYVESWTKVAAEEKRAGDSLEPACDKTEHDLKSVIQRLEESNKAQGDTSPVSDPPASNP